MGEGIARAAGAMRVLGMTATEVAATFKEMVRLLDPPNTDADFCDYSFLRKEWCAHCLGHYLDPEIEEATKP